MPQTDFCVASVLFTQRLLMCAAQLSTLVMHLFLCPQCAMSFYKTKSSEFKA